MGCLNLRAINLPHFCWNLLVRNFILWLQKTRPQEKSSANHSHYKLGSEFHLWGSNNIFHKRQCTWWWLGLANESQKRSILSRCTWLWQDFLCLYLVLKLTFLDCSQIQRLQSARPPLSPGIRGSIMLCSGVSEACWAQTGRQWGLCVSQTPLLSLRVAQPHLI